MEQARTHVVEICANLDDAPGELVGHAMQTLLDEGALDVWTTPITMKKQRPGVMLSLLADAADQSRLAHRMIELTGSFGVRYRDWDRLVLEREHQSVDTPVGGVRVKLGFLDGRLILAKPEFEDVRQRAEEAGWPLPRAMSAASAAADALLERLRGGRR